MSGMEVIKSEKRSEKRASLLR